MMEFCLIYGNEKFVTGFKQNEIFYQLRTLSKYYNVKDGIDRGESIRNKSKTIMNLLENSENLN